MSKARLLFLLVAYHNMAEVEEFIAHLREKDPSDSFRIAVCDNTENAVDPDHGRAGIGYVLTARPDNPGYLEGALEAHRSYVAHGGEPVDWIVISNSDLRLRSEGLLSILDSRYDPCVPVVVAPRVTEAFGVEKNPHVLEPRTAARLRANRVLTATPTIALGYLRVSALKAAFRARRRSARGPHEEKAIPERQTIYSPYGAIVIFSAAFFDEVGLPPDVPLLAEEFAVAEAALKAGAPIWFEPQIHFFHEEHSTTGPKVTRRRAHMLSRAFRYIDEAPKTR